MRHPRFTIRALMLASSGTAALVWIAVRPARASSVDRQSVVIAMLQGAIVVGALGAFVALVAYTRKGR
jgi:hypothetical protein